MESVASYPSPVNNRGGLSSRLVPSNRMAPAAISGRFNTGGHRKVVVMRVDEHPAEETRDEPQVASQRWDSERSWKPPAAGMAVASYERVLCDTNGATTRHLQTGHPYLESSRQLALRHQHWHHHHQHLPDHHWHHGGGGQHPANHTRYIPSERPRRPTGGMVPVSSKEDEAIVRQLRTSSYGSATSRSTYTTVMSSSSPQSHAYQSSGLPRSNNPRRPRSHHYHHQSMNSSVVVIPKNIVIPKEIAPTPPRSTTPRSEVNIASNIPIGKRSNDVSEGANSPERGVKRAKTSSGEDGDAARLEGKFDKLDLLCSATLELGPLQDNPTGCSCPKSKCIALYCDCFKAGRRCNPQTCTCLNCKNTLIESGPDGARSKAIQSILARNPRAFTNGGSNTTTAKLPPGEQACNCIRSRCLKLYCTCFQVGKSCNPETCTCVGCLNTHQDDGGHRQAAIEATLEKRPDAFGKPKAKEIGSGCACKNNRCIRKYCECFRTNLACTKKCSCRDCENQETESSSSLVMREAEPLEDDSPSTVATMVSK